MKFSRWTIVFVISSLPLVSALAKNKVPLPTQILVAKTVYIDNQSGYGAIGDQVSDELKKWGRFKIVGDWKEADLVLLLTPRDYNRGYVNAGGGQTGRADETGNINTTANPIYTTPGAGSYIFFTVIDPKTGTYLWGDSKKWDNPFSGSHSTARGLVQEFRKRVGEQTNPKSEQKNKKN
jgi:hypothetical protein